MNTTQLLLFALNCINENRETTHTEKSHIYVFYKNEIENKQSINDFMLNFESMQICQQIEQQKRAQVIAFVEGDLLEA
ncbi:hypothetical protein [Providencia sp. PROV_01]